MKSCKRVTAAALMAAFLCFSLSLARAQDVRGYSVIKGQFLNQTSPGAPVLDLDYGYSILASVDLTDFNLVTNASVRLPSGTREVMDDQGDSWGYLDSFTTFSALNSRYGWGNYTIDFKTVNDGNFSCVLALPNTPLPPAPRLVNFADVQAVNPVKPLTVSWDFSATPKADDFVQVYITIGHDEVFSTPDLGEPGALDSTARSVTVPADTLAQGAIYSLTLEITRLVSTNSTCYTSAEGITATFSSTSIDVTTIVLPQLRLLSRPVNGVVSVEVQGDAGKTIVLQDSDDLMAWRDLATNAAASGSNLFTVANGGQAARIFRARQQ
jgi:hypothetical protein